VTGDRWDSWPTHKSQEFFLEMMERHDDVTSVKNLAPNLYDVTLDDGTEVKVFMTDVYEFTVSDYANLRAKHSGVNCIVMASNWNHFTDAARADARADGIATFHFKGLMGALNSRGDEFLDYPDIQF
jgi:hypothetical protein